MVTALLGNGCATAPLATARHRPATAAPKTRRAKRWMLGIMLVSSFLDDRMDKGEWIAIGSAPVSLVATEGRPSRPPAPAARRPPGSGARSTGWRRTGAPA